MFSESSVLFQLLASLFQSFFISFSKVEVMRCDINEGHIFIHPCSSIQAPAMSPTSPSRNTSCGPSPSFQLFPLPEMLSPPWTKVISFRKTCWHRYSFSLLIYIALVTSQCTFSIRIFFIL